MAARATLIAVWFGVVATAGVTTRAQEPQPQPPALGTSLAADIRLVEHTTTRPPPPSAAAARAAQYPKVTVEGTSERSVRKQAVTEVPLGELTPSQQQRCQKILDNISFFRRLPTLNFAVDPQVYGYFTQHPEAAVSIWRAMKISKVQMWQTGKYEYESDVGDGSTGEIEVLHQTPNVTLVLCDGLYKSPLSKRPIEAKSLVLLKSTFSRSASGTVFVTHRADVFVSFPSQTLDVAAKIFSPLAISMTDATFSEISLFLKMMSVAMSRRPEWVEGLVEKMDGVQEIRKKQLVELTTQVYTAYQKRALQESEAEIRAESAASDAAGVQAARATELPK